MEEKGKDPSDYRSYLDCSSRCLCYRNGMKMNGVPVGVSGMLVRLFSSYVFRFPVSNPQKQISSIVLTGVVPALFLLLDDRVQNSIPQT